MNETHNGNKNRSKIVAKPDEGTKSAGKSNGPEATLRAGSLPKSEAVRHVDRDANNGAAIREALKQNVSLTSDGTKILNVISNSGKAFLSHNLGGESATGHETVKKS